MATGISRRSDATRERLLEAATSEFAQYGLAGGRIDRIAAAAPANKQAIYLYFGSKEKLFDAVITRQTEEFGRAVPFAADDLPAYGIALFDYLATHPELRRLLLWKELEGSAPGEEELASYQDKTAAIGALAEKGSAIGKHSSIDILSIVLAISQNWMHAGAPIHSLTAEDPWGPARLDAQRKAIQDVLEHLL